MQFCQPCNNPESAQAVPLSPLLFTCCSIAITSHVAKRFKAFRATLVLDVAVLTNGSKFTSVYPFTPFPVLFVSLSLYAFYGIFLASMLVQVGQSFVEVVQQIFYLNFTIRN